MSTGPIIHSRSPLVVAAVCILLLGVAFCCAQQPADIAQFSGTVRLPKGDTGAHRPAVVVWLTPVDPTTLRLPDTPGRFTLTQKNRTFIPHLLVVPVGSVVTFPNADPFFHNVFSLFNGKRFDLGLYEAGSTKEVVFSREGVSYIFCNIHPEMSAVVLALSSPLYSILDQSSNFAIDKVPPGDYDLHVWIESTPEPVLSGLMQRIQVRLNGENRATLDASNASRVPAGHMNKYGKPYSHDSGSSY